MGVVPVQLQDGTQDQAGQGPQGAAVTDEVACHHGPHPEALLESQDKITVVQQDCHGHQQTH